jgi:hypothetical protein
MAGNAAAEQSGKNSETPFTYKTPDGREITTNVNSVLHGGDGYSPAGGNVSPSASQPKSIRMPDGTIVPAPVPAPDMQRSNGGMVTGPSVTDAAVTKSAGDEIAGTVSNYNTNIMARQRLMTIANALKSLQSGSLDATKAQWGAELAKYGIDIWKDSAAQAQIALKQNAMASMDTLSSRLSRWTQQEFATVRSNMANPDLQPAANAEIIGQGIGLIDHDMAMARGWQAYRKAGGTDPAYYTTNWNDKNQLQGFIDRAKAEVGPLKGMSASTPTNASAPKPVQSIQSMITPAQIQATAMRNHMTVPQAKAELRRLGYQVQ